MPLSNASNAISGLGQALIIQISISFTYLKYNFLKNREQLDRFRPLLLGNFFWKDYGFADKFERQSIENQQVSEEICKRTVMARSY